MSELYRAIAGSPITYLAADISANQTTISIADDSALPDAPNICTIGYGENIETIRYGAKSNGVLQNVTRGIEGTPRAWKAGTEVARFFTAYDHNAIIETIESHLENVAYSGVQSSDVSQYITGNFQYYKSFGTVFFTITRSFIREQLESFGSRTIFTLPSGFRPRITSYFPLIFDANVATAVIQITPNGNVAIYSRQGTTISTNTPFIGSGCFPV